MLLTSVVSLSNLCCFYRYTDHRVLHVQTHSCPTRRSTDLRRASRGRASRRACHARSRPTRRSRWPRRSRKTPPSRGSARATGRRSEEHTSELQSLMRSSYAVFCLKKKTTDTPSYNKHHINKNHTRRYTTTKNLTT